MPFPDEVSTGISVVDYRAEWPSEFEKIAEQLLSILGALVIDHVGSTSVPGLPAKDCIDVQIRVADLDEGMPLAGLGFRLRPEPWNHVEVSSGQECQKLVFAPPVGARTCNVHVRLHSAPNARYALLFRDYLRADERARDGWGAFKQRLAVNVTDLMDYGQIKAPATEVLMAGAERWATATGWAPS
ncbi:GrpB family protein [Kribbella sp. NPDC006257]|uniref:GrpB family protein n=1 Tax=Kribbella sp. NPDC006257 TaxID=3156738 RepID=UPI0033AE017A